MTDFIENSNETPSEAGHLDQLVGEGKKYKDVEALAKAYANVEAFAENLKRENSEQREELTRRLTIEEQVRNLAQNRAEQPSANQPNEPNPAPAVKPLTEEDLVARVRESLKSDETKAKQDANSRTVVEQLISTFGDQAKVNEFVEAKAAKLGLSIQWLQDVAKTSPTAFFELVGLDAAPTATPGVSRSEVNTSALSQTNVVKPGTYAYFEEMRKTDPRKYFSATTQNQIMKAALANPEKFGLRK